MDFASLSDMQSIQGGLDPSGATGGVAPSQQDQDNYAQASANILAEPIVGRNRSNIVGSVNYDPTFAAAFDISRGLDPTNNFGGTGGLAVPSYLRPQVAGNKVLNEAGDRQMFYSPVERFMQEDLTDFVKSAPGIAGIFGRGLDSLFGGIDFLNNSKAGKTVEEEIEDEKRIEIADLEEQRQNKLTDPSFMAAPIDTVTKTSLDKLDDRPSIQELAEQRKTQNALNVISDMFDNRGIVSLPQAADLQNQQIAAGEKTGKTLNVALPERKNLAAFTGPGFLQSNLVEPFISKTKDKQGPPEPSVEAPPGFVDIVMGEDRTPRFAGTNMSIYGGKGPGQLVRPKNELEAKAATDAGFSLVPFTPMFEKPKDPRDYTASGVLTGVNLPAAEFRFKREPEVATRFKISDLPREIQEVVSLRSDLDYGTSFPLQTILDARREVDSGNFTEKEMSDFLAGFR